MAQQTVVTTPDVAANSGQGTPLATAFEWINDNFDEVYAKPDLSLATNTLTLTKADGTTDTVDLSPYLDEDATAVASATLSGSTITFTRLDSSTFDLDVSTLLGDITSIAAGNGLTGSNLDSGDATLNVVGGDGITANADEVEVTVDDSTIELSASDGTGAIRIKALGVDTGQLAADAVDGTKIADDSIDSEHYVDGSIDTAHIADDQITHDKLEDRYTVEVTKTDTSGTGGSAVTLDWSTGAIFHFSNSLTGAIELKFDEYKANQVIDIYGLTGSQTVTLNSTASGTEVFKRIGTQEYDGTADNHIQVICLDDSASTPVFHYAIGTTTSTATA